MRQAPDTGRVRTLIVDDHPITRLGLRTLLCSLPELEVLGEACSLAEARHWLARDTPQLAVVDLKLKDGDGLELVREYRDRTRFVVVTMFGDANTERAARAAGAHGFAHKETASVHLTSTVREALAEWSALRPTKSVALSRREREVLELVAQGRTNGEIASHLNISITTVRTHVVHILEKLGARDRTEAAVLAVRDGLLPHAPR